MDEFFQRLREIQKKERSLSGLSNVEENFYQDVFKYLDGLMEKIGNNPFSFESYLLRDTQRIVAEICERREHKITNSAVMNVQRSYQLFKELGEDQNIPILRNSTSEERTLYRELFTSLVKHRKEMNYPISSSIVKNRHASEKSKLSPEVPRAKDETGSLEAVIKDSSQPIQPKPLTDQIYKEFGQEPKPSGKKEDRPADIHIDRTQNKKKNVHKSEINPSQPNVHREVLVITEELPSIMGVDSNVYGPLLPGDIITMPEPNAKILIKNQKGKLIQRYK